jgi:hypothetical protein
MVRDLGSLNGTFINNQRITESVIEPGELLTIGAVTFRAVYESAEGPTESGPQTAQPQAAAKQPSPSADATIPADEIADVEIEELPPEGQPGSTVRPEEMADEVLDVADIEVEESASKTTMPRPEPVDPQEAEQAGSESGSPEHAEGNDEDEDDLDNFLRSLGQK